MIPLTVWLIYTEDKRTELLSYAVSPIPTDPGERQLDISKALQLAQDAGDILADLEQHLSSETGKAVLEVRSKFEGMNSDERKIMVKDIVSQVARYRDGMKVIYNSIKDRKFALMSLGRW